MTEDAPEPDPLTPDNSGEQDGNSNETSDEAQTEVSTDTMTVEEDAVDVQEDSSEHTEFEPSEGTEGGQEADGGETDNSNNGAEERELSLREKIRKKYGDVDPRLSLYVLLPDKFTNYIEREARYARVGAYRHMTANLVIGYFALLFLAVYLLGFSLMWSAIVFLAASPFSLVLPYALFSILAERRKRAIEQVLPDALLLMSANIESGLTVEKAFLLSARDEFGPLADDIQRTAMKMFGGVPVEDALDDLTQETNSELFAETLKLLIDGINAGGEASALLESSADDIRNSLHLREEIEANVKMYSIFILMAAVLGAPMMFAISTYLAETTNDLWGEQNIDMDDMPDSGIMEMSAPDINVEFFRVFAVASIIISNMFAALILSEIKNGNVKYGLKYVPVFVIIAVIIYFVADIIISSALGGTI